jgi:hypothetical protein
MTEEALPYDVARDASCAFITREQFERALETKTRSTERGVRRRTPFAPERGVQSGHPHTKHRFDGLNPAHHARWAR